MRAVWIVGEGTKKSLLHSMCIHSDRLGRTCGTIQAVEIVPRRKREDRIALQWRSRMVLDANSVLQQLEKGDTSSTTILRLLSLAKEQKLRKSGAVTKYGMVLLKSPANRASLGNDLWNYYEQVCMAALDVFSLEDAEFCLSALQKKFPSSNRVSRLQAMYNEAKGDWKKAESTYRELLEKDPADTSSHKRLIALIKVC